MRIEGVETFYWAATLRSVTEASRRVFVTQTAASERIAALERELGVALLARGSDRRFRLTREGERFLVDAERLLGLWREIKANLEVSRPSDAPVRLGVVESVLHSWLVPWIEQVSASHADLDLELTVETTPILVERLRRGRLDLIVAAHPASGPGLRAFELPAMPMVFAGSRQHNRQRRYSLAQLAEAGLMTFQRGSQPEIALADLLRAERITPRVTHTVSSIAAMARMVTAGLGVATLPRDVVTALKSTHGLRVLPCASELPPLPVHVGFREDPASVVLPLVLEHLRATAGRPTGLR